MNERQNSSKPVPSKGALPWLTTILLALSLVLVAMVLRNDLRERRASELLGDFDLRRVLYDIQRYHVNGLTREQAIHGILAGLAGELDRYARCYTPDELQSHMQEMEGSFTGLGIRVVKIGKYITVVYPIPNTAAEKAGIRTGDRLVEADGHNLVDLPLDEAIHYLRGPVNSLLKLKVLRGNSDEPLTLEIIRAPVPSTSLSYAHMPAEDIGYVRIEEFTRTTADDLKTAAERLRKKGMKGLILDIRHNGGGLLNAGVAVADLFLAKGVVVTVKNGRQDNPDVDIYRAASGDELEDLPLVLLVDGRTASASEILAAAMRDHDRARVVGSKTYGKGTVQQLFTEGLGGFGLKFTVAYFYTPKGKRIDGAGVLPDREVKLSDEDFAKVMLRYSTEEIRRFLPSYEPDLSGWGITADELMSLKDPMMEPAVELLRERMREHGKAPPAPDEPTWRPGSTGMAQ